MYLPFTFPRHIYSIDSTTYYDYLQIFANDTSNRAWDSEIVYDDDENPTKIVATRVGKTCVCV